MPKPFLFEFEDLSWFPDMIREGMTDYLRFIFTIGNLYKPILPVLADAVQRANAKGIVDLCSGSGGPIEQVAALLTKQGIAIPIMVTDKFPNIPAFKLLHYKSNGIINYVSYPVDAMKVPPDIKGFRTIFSGFHHFSKTSAIAILNDTVAANEGIAIFDGGDRSLLFIFTVLLLQPVSFLLLTPFIKPFRWSRILFTYLIPLIPICTVWDGIVSTIRLHTVKELLSIAKTTNSTKYYWKAGKVRNKMGIHIAYLIGYPIAKE
jgi:hypothetical protein